MSSFLFGQIVINVVFSISGTQRTSFYFSNNWKLCHQKRRGDFEMVILSVLNASWTKFTGNFQGAKKRLQTNIITKHKSFQPNKFYNFSSMDFKG
jgi:hypothetical protein